LKSILVSFSASILTVQASRNNVIALFFEKCGNQKTSKVVAVLRIRFKN